ncbi:hypothetical protein [Micromonospora sp. NBC_01412]|uniref:hypothetical protein n=1 Tax=Micromonospora sp. NBC_01412 TaxID=2903590 RepID=UPI0032464D32
MGGLYGDLTVEELRERCAGWDRAALLADFDRLCDYRSAADWNALVRVCEAFALIGWGDREPVEAFAERWINGSFYTQLQDVRFRAIAGTAHGWSRRGDTFVVDGGPETVDPSVTALHSQRIPLAKNPVRLVRSGNYQIEAKPFVDELARLRGLLDERLARPYGPGFGYLGLRLLFSLPHGGPGLGMEYFHDDIGPPSAPDAKPFLRPRLELGRLTRRRGEVVLTVERHYTDAEARAGLDRQKRDFAADLVATIDGLATKLRRKAPEYRLDELRADLDTILDEWMPSA